MSELDQEFNKYSKKNIKYTFNPHLLPTFRGILSSIYIETNNKISFKKIYYELKKFHSKNKFIKWRLFFFFQNYFLEKKKFCRKKKNAILLSQKV